MKAYSVVGVSDGTHTGIAGVVCTTSFRARIFEWNASCNDAPADQSWQPTIARFTAVGVSTSATPQPLDPADVASQLTGGITYTTDPTFAASNLQQVSINQRASWKWQATPGCELVGAAVSNNGIALYGHAPTAGIHESGCIMYYE